MILNDSFPENTMSVIQNFGVLELTIMAVLTAYIGLAFYAAYSANRQVFPAPPPGYLDSEDIIKLTYAKPDQKVSLVYLENPDSRYLVYYHHGNGEDLKSIRPRLESLRKAGFAVLAWDYPGYGTSDGKPTERLVKEIAEKIWTKIPESYGFAYQKVILYGRSLGGGPAVWLASKYKAAGLIMEGTFASIFRVGLPMNFLPWDIFDNLKLIGSVRCPSLFIHGTHDKRVPFSHAEKLYAKAPEPKFFAWMDNGQHNDVIESYPDIYYNSLTRFIEHLDKQ